jgi:hypothetical protein
MPDILLYFVVLFQGFSGRFAVFGLLEKHLFPLGFQEILMTREAALRAVSLGIEGHQIRWLPRMDSNHE